MSNVRSRKQLGDMRNRALLLLLSCVLSQASAQPASVLSAGLFTMRLPDGWSAKQTNGEIELVPSQASEAELVGVSECAKSDRACLSECSVATAQSYLWFFKNNQPPATYRSVPRSDGLFEYRANGRFGESDVWASIAILCGKSGLAVVVSQSPSGPRANAHLEAVVQSVSWASP
jgi:hypothetical protein